MMMTRINRLKTYHLLPIPPPPFNMVAHLRPHVSNLKAAFVFLRRCSALWYYRQETCGQGPRLHVWAPIQPSSISPTIFLSLRSLINVLCVPWCCIIHQTKWPGSALRQTPRLPSLPLTFTRCCRERKSIFHLLSVGNILWQSNNLSRVPFECLTMCLLKKTTKVCEPQGLATWLFWSCGSPLTSALQSKQQVVLPPLWLFYTRLWEGFFSWPHQTQTA